MNTSRSLTKKDKNIKKKAPIILEINELAKEEDEAKIIVEDVIERDAKEEENKKEVKKYEENQEKEFETSAYEEDEEYAKKVEDDEE